MSALSLPLLPEMFAPQPRVIAQGHGFTATTFRYGSGVEALRLQNSRGYLIVLPFLGQMIWDAEFDGQRLTMGSVFAEPHAGASILETYGAFAYHAGVLRNGTPGPQDSHPLHGEMPVARLREAYLHFGQDAQGDYAEITGLAEYVMGFGPHYHARPRIRLPATSAVFEVEMQVENRSAHPMELMYMLHANFAFVANARLHQAAPYDPSHVVVRRAVPSHVTPSPEFLELLNDLGDNPSRMAQLTEPDLYSPEQVFYLKNLQTDADGQTQMLMQLPQNDAFTLAYRPQDLPHCVRWIFNDGDAQVAAFALPATCEPEGYTAEKAKGHVRSLAPGQIARFPVRLGYLSASEAAPVLTRLTKAQPA